MKTATKTKKSQDRWLLPDAAGWTLGPLDTAERETVPQAGGARAEGVVWPMQCLVGLPVWLAGHEAATFSGAAALQMEKMGLGPRAYHEESLRVTEISRDADRTLVMAVALARRVKDSDVCLSAKTYVTPLESLAWPADRVVLCREQEKWVAVITRGTQPVYFAVFNGLVLPTHVASDLACMAEGLRRSGVIVSLSGVTLWDAAGAATEQALRDDLGLPVVLAARPPWHPPTAGVNLIHPAVIRHRGMESRARQVRQVLVVLGVVLLAVLGVSGGRVFWASRELAVLEKEYASLQEQSEGIREVARRWRQLEGTVDRSYYPLEHLRAVSALLPANGVRLTEFQWKEGQLRLTGEATDTTMAYAYAEGLKSHDQFAWEMDQPNIQPNNSAQFVVKGKGAR